MNTSGIKHKIHSRNVSETVNLNINAITMIVFLHSSVEHTGDDFCNTLDLTCKSVEP